MTAAGDGGSDHAGASTFLVPRDSTAAAAEAPVDGAGRATDATRVVAVSGRAPRDSARAVDALAFDRGLLAGIERLRFVLWSAGAPG